MKKPTRAVAKPKPAAKAKAAAKPAAKPKKEAKFLTMHPDKTKKGVNISKEKYEAVKAALLAAIPAGRSISHENLIAAVEKKLGKTFEGSVPWYAESVKLDLEARKIIQRSKGSPQMISKI